MDTSYDCTADTLKHIRRVQELLGEMAMDLIRRGIDHDESKLGPVEKPLYDANTPRLAALTYGSDEYKAALADLGPALQHHYRNNSHHPEHYPDGVRGMTLADVVEMFCDWKAATERHNDGSIERSISINQQRFGLSDELAQIFRNTAIANGWIKGGVAA